MIMKQSDSRLSLATYYFSMFDDMELLLPLNKDTVSKAFARGMRVFINKMLFSKFKWFLLYKMLVSKFKYFL